MTDEKENMNIVIVGHVDHGKSTIVGRLLADTHSLPQGKLEQVRANCERNSKPFEYAFLIDALKDEQAQGITIDTARVFFKTEKRNYIILDAPGHIEFLKNMVTGASRAEAALLVIDAAEGIKENSRRHGYLLSMLGIRQVIVLVNKMDLAGYSRDKFGEIEREFSEFLKSISIRPNSFIPVSGFCGDNIASAGFNMPWYEGLTLLNSLDSFQNEKDRSNKPFRMPVQDVYKFTKYGDNRRIVAGTIETGSIQTGDEIVFYPSGKKNRIKSIEASGSSSIAGLEAGYAAGFTMDEQIYVTRGEIIAKIREVKPLVSMRLRVNLFWLGRNPLEKNKEYLFKLGTAKVPCRIESIPRLIDASTLSFVENAEKVNRNDVGECIIRLRTPIAFDLNNDIPETGRFVIVEAYEISGGGIVRESLPDEQSEVREKVILRNYKWEKSAIPSVQRAERYSQKSALLVITGDKDVGKKKLAKRLEEILFQEGKFIYFLGIGNILYGVDADLNHDHKKYREEHIRRLAEVAFLMMDAGIILVITAVGLTQDDLDIMKTVLDENLIHIIWVGEPDTDIATDLVLLTAETETGVDKIRELMFERGIIFKPW